MSFLSLGVILIVFFSVFLACVEVCTRNYLVGLHLWVNHGFQNYLICWGYDGTELTLVVQMIILQSPNPSSAFLLAGRRSSCPSVVRQDNDTSWVHFLVHPIKLIKMRFFTYYCRPPQLFLIYKLMTPGVNSKWLEEAKVKLKCVYPIFTKSILFFQFWCFLLNIIPTPCIYSYTKLC